jgi:hypothetical protein
MFERIFGKTQTPVSLASEERFSFDPPREARDIERLYARLFSSEDGRRVLAHLQAVTFGRALGPASPDAQLRHMEGQRAMVATILRLVDRGRQG